MCIACFCETSGNEVNEKDMFALSNHEGKAQISIYEKMVVQWVGQSYSIQCNACNGATAARLPSAEVSIMGKVLVQVRSCSKHLGEIRPTQV